VVTSFAVQGVDVPAFLYGTAWKEARTQALVEEALAAGFRGIDTANQRRHYVEAAAGAGVAAAVARGEVTRDALFLQTKFTYVEGQDARLPYDPRAPLPTQVRQSFESSLEHLGVEQLDAYLLHGPRSGHELTPDDVAVWRAMEELHVEGRVRLLGASNVHAGQIAALCDLADVPPALVQNRCFARLGWDREARAVCRAHGVVYQGFSLLTANREVLGSAPLLRASRRRGATAAQVVFALARQLGMVCLTGTSDPAHMREDLASVDLELDPEEVRELESLAG
jgi:diketogulonate reductase-like aldo/keto reductase